MKYKVSRFRFIAFILIFLIPLKQKNFQKIVFHQWFTGLYVTLLCYKLHYIMKVGKPGKSIPDVSNQKSILMSNIQIFLCMFILLFWRFLLLDLSMRYQNQSTHMRPSKSKFILYGNGKILIDVAHFVVHRTLQKTNLHNREHACKSTISYPSNPSNIKWSWTS